MVAQVNGKNSASEYWGKPHQDRGFFSWKNIMNGAHVMNYSRKNKCKQTFTMNELISLCVGCALWKCQLHVDSDS